MNKPLRVLIVEDVEEDALLLVAELKRGGYDPTFERVETAEDMTAALTNKKWDFVFIDYGLPQFNAIEAIRMVSGGELDLPTIVISGTVGEEAAVEVMKAGAHDIVLKHNLSRLIPAMERELEKAKVRRAQRLAEKAARLSDEKVKEMRRYLSHLIESSPDAIISTDEKGDVMLFNRGAEALLGYLRDEVIGERATMLYESEEQAKAVMRQMRQHGGVVSNFEITKRAKDGSLIPALISASILYDEDGQEVGTVGFSKDLRERKKGEEALRESEEKYQDLYDNAPDMFVSIDAETAIILRCNQTLAKKLNYSKEEIIGRPVFDLYHPDCMEDARKAFRSFAETGIVRDAELQLNRKDGSKIDVILNVSAVRDEKGKILYSRSIWRDITELKQVQAVAITSEKLAAVGRLTAGVSHEVLNPLNFITLCLQRLLDDPDHSPELAEDLRDIQEHSNRIVKITQGLLSFSRQRAPERTSINLNDTVTKTLALLDYDLKLQNISVELNLAEGLPLILADEDQLRQVILNLLTNARDVMPKGGRLVLSTAEVEPLFENERRPLELRVEDTGPGIAAEHMDKLFEPFFTTKDVGEGTGLGLSICQGIIESHGGVIRAENVPGGGAVFIVHLNVGGEDAKQNISS